MSKISIYKSKVFSDQCIYMICYVDGERVGSGNAEVIVYDPRNAKGRWCRYRFEGWIADVLPLSDAPDARLAAYGLTSEGEFLAFGAQPHTEQIPGAGPRYGFQGDLTCMTLIGQEVVVGGRGGQLFKRNVSGKWSQLEKSNPKFYQEDMDVIRIAAVDDQSFIVLAGHRRQGFVFYWDGHKLIEAKTHISQRFTDIYVEKSNRIWICGWRGALLFGNLVDGFAPVFTRSTSNLLKIQGFNGAMYASDPTLLMLDNGLFPFKLGGQSIGDVCSLNATEKNLVIVEDKRILLFDGIYLHSVDLPQDWPT